MDRIWLDVPFDEKDKAKAAGAKWDPAAKQWYAPQKGIRGLAVWKALPPLPEVLPGEDRTFGGKALFVDMVPQSCWFTNVRSCVEKRDWERIRRIAMSRAGNVCEICGTGTNAKNKIGMEVHERWDYVLDTRTQVLKRLICLCTSCHEATHFGFAQIKGAEAEAITHLRQVNGWSEKMTQSHIADATQLWRYRSMATWNLDLSILTDAGVTLRKPPDAAVRRDVAKRKTWEVRY